MITKLYGEFGFINKPIINIPSNIFMPKKLYERVITTDNLDIIGNSKGLMTGGGISFNIEEAENSAFGEFVERYASSFQIDKGLLFGSFNELCNIHKCLDPKEIKYYNDNQYKDKNFKLKKLENDTKVNWIVCKNYISNENILLPFFMTNVENIIGEGMFHINTTTGTACHVTLEKAVESGLMECIERDAFCKFWYLQKINNYKKYSAKFILEQYPNDTKINTLFNNKKIKIITFDLSEFAYCSTFVTIIYFRKKNKTYQSMGSASRLNHKEALIKSCIEAYQGIEYIELVCEKNKFHQNEIQNFNFKSIDSFSKHFALYNSHPELMDKIPLFRNILKEEEFSNIWKENHNHHIKSLCPEELKDKGLEDVYYTELTTVDVKQLKLYVVKVVTPKLHLLTGNFNYPYLGLFDADLDLMTEMPHPFP